MFVYPSSCLDQNFDCSQLFRQMFLLLFPILCSTDHQNAQIVYFRSTFDSILKQSQKNSEAVKSSQSDS